MLRKPWLNHLFVLLAPLVLLGSVARLSDIRGPFYAKANFDPEYQYLMNGVAILFGSEPKHRDHPGTTIQSFAAVGLKAFYRGANREVILERVIRDPERALSFLSVALVFCCLLVIGFAGILVSRALGHPAWGIAYQMLLFSSPTVWPFLSRFTPDLPSITLSALFVGLWLNRQYLANAFIYGILMGTKVTAGPLILLPIVELWPQKRRHLLAWFAVGSVGLFLATLPILSKESIAYIGSWLFRLTIHSQHYGEGTVGLPPLTQMSSSLLALLFAHPLVPAALGTWLVCREWCKTSFFQACCTSVRNRTQLGLGLALLFSLLLVVKHPSPHYLLAALPLAAGLMLLNLRILINPSSHHWRTLAVASLSGLCAVFAGLIVIRQPSYREDFLEFENQIQTAVSQENCRLLTTFWTATIDGALSFGNSATGNRFTEILRARNPDFLIFSGADHVETYAQKTVNLDLLKDRPLCLLASEDRLRALPASTQLQTKHWIYNPRFYGIYRVQIR